MSTYTVMIFRFKQGPKVFKRGLTLEEAREICNDPETSSRTASEPEKYGSEPWFFGYTEE